MRQLVNYYFLAEGGVRKVLIKKYATKTKRHKVLVLKSRFPLVPSYLRDLVAKYCFSDSLLFRNSLGHL